MSVWKEKGLLLPHWLRKFSNGKFISMYFLFIQVALTFSCSSGYLLSRWRIIALKLGIGWPYKSFVTAESRHVMLSW